ncbi:MAG TPA: DUF192 domain-containing protein [Vicinamibacterales bacterium]|nr:DUF192 domain-containing protein [Vicinamibacterales bacterium]
MTPDVLRGVSSGGSGFLVRNADTGLLMARNLEVAATRSARRRGLLGRERFAPGDALWIVPSRGVHTCGMRFAIDVVALDARGVVVDVVTDLRPWRLRLPRPGTLGVLELPAGAVRESQTRLGHRISFEPLAPAQAAEAASLGRAS